jgi:hypothetical protein
MNNRNEEEFKKSLNDILNSKEFGFDEANWKGAEALINGKRRKKRLVVYFILSALLIFTSSAYFYVISHQPDTKNIIASVPQIAKINQASGPTQSTEEKQTIKPSSDQMIKPEKETTQLTQLNKKQTAQKELPVNEKLPETNALPLPSKAIPNVSHVSSPVVANSVVKNATLKTTKEDKLSTTQKVEPIASKISANQINPLVNPMSTSSPKSDGLVVQETIKESVNYSTTLKEDGVNVNTNNSTSLIPTNTLAEIKKSEPPTNPISESQNQKNNITQSIPSTVAVNSETSKTIVAIDSLQKPSVIAKPDTSSTQALASLDPCATRDKIFAELGMNYILGWKYGSSREAAGLSPILGVHYSNKLTKKLTASAGLRYTTLSRLQISSKTSKVTTYKLAEESDVTTITPLKVYYISLPLQLAYQLNCNNQIGVGYNLDYMVNVISNVETYHVGVSKNQTSSSSKSLGYQEGFKSFSSRLSLLYRRRILKELWFNAEITYGLTDIKQNNFFVENKFERNTGVGISLMYNFLK